jgi:hypothetical protein
MSPGRARGIAFAVLGGLTLLAGQGGRNLILSPCRIIPAETPTFVLEALREAIGALAKA